MADIKILMMGGRRCGKSSILASMVHQLSNNVELCKKYIQITPYAGDDGTAKSLEAKRNDLVSFIENKPTGSHYLVDFNADDKFNKYYFKAKIPKLKVELIVAMSKLRLWTVLESALIQMVGMIV